VKYLEFLANVYFSAAGNVVYVAVYVKLASYLYHMPYKQLGTLYYAYSHWLPEDSTCAETYPVSYCQGCVREDNMVEAKAKAKATKFCPRGVLEVEASPRGPPSRSFFLPRLLRRERL